MKLCLCIDKNNGIMFFGKRPSQDRVQRAEMLTLIGKTKLWISKYSASLFESAENIIVDDDYMSKAQADDYCFVEDKEIDLKKCSTIVVYNWNRHYPADKFFTFDLKKEGFKKISSRDFVGSSHEKITEEIYERRMSI